MGWHVMGWKVDREQRGELLARFRPRYANAVADHVTLRVGVEPREKLPEDTQGEIVGRADDGEGVEALVVRIGAGTERPGGGTYHITWSLADGRTAKESNDVIAARGWERVEPGIPVKLKGAFF